MKERRTSHRGICNKVKQKQISKVGDLVKYHIKVHPKSETVEAKKLSYQAQGPFKLKTVLGDD